MHPNDCLEPSPMTVVCPLARLAGGRRGSVCLALALLWLVLTGCGCASVNPHWNEAPPDVRVSGWQFFSPRDYPEELATWH